MTSKKSLQSWLPLMLSSVMVLGMLGGYQLNRHMDWRNRPVAKSSGNSVQQVMDLIQLKYIDSIRLDSVENAGIQSLVNQLDPHSAYIAPSGMSDANASLAGNFGGIGIEYLIINDTVNVTWVVEKGPSHNAGLQVGDFMIAVNDSNIAGQNISNETLRGMLRGKPNSEVTVTLLRNGTRTKATIKRGAIPLPSLDAAYMAAADVGYIRLNRFSETTFFEFMDAATALEKKGMKKMILDLRGNGGGLLEEATKIADELLPDGLKIVSTRGNHVKTREIYSTKPGIFEKGKLAVLMDELSASASEVLAGALQDNDRATVIGRRSFGKGLVQEQFTLANGGALRLTIARYYTPTGRSIQKPYNGTRSQYRNEIMDRFHATNGTSTLPDTAGRQTFTTKTGRTLYDAGGITPEIVIPPDSTALPLPLVRLYRLPNLNDYIFNIYKQNRSQVIAYSSPVLFANEFNLPPSAWTLLKEQAAVDSVKVADFSPADKAAVADRIKALIARYHWRTQGYYEVINLNDAMMGKALEFMSEP